MVVVAGLAWREVLSGKTWRNTPVCLLVSVFAIANLVFLVQSNPELGQRLGLVAIALLISLIGGRVVPSFTRNWLAKQNVSDLPAAFGTYDKLCLIVLLAALVTWLISPNSIAAGLLMLVTALSHAIRLVRWRGVAWRHGVSHWFLSCMLDTDGLSWPCSSLVLASFR